MEDLQLKNEELVKENKKLTAELRKMARDVAAQKRQLRIMEMSYQSRNVMYRSQINENAKQRHFLTHFMQSSQNFVIFLDEEEHVAYISKRILDYIGVDFEDMVEGMHVKDFYQRYFHQEHADLILSAIDTVSTTMEPVENNITLYDKQDGERYYHNLCSPMSDEEMKLCGLIIIYYDETDIITAMTQAVEANNTKTKFLTTMSHEIRTPMNAIIGISEIGMGREGLSPETVEDLEKIHNSGYTLLGIINDLLDFSKIESGKLEITPDTYELASLIHDSAQLNATRIGSKELELILEVAPDLPSMLIGDELRIKQILNNILSNAIKYTEQGQVIFSVKKGNCEGNTIEIVFEVKDTGQGMSKEQLEQLFDPYSRFNSKINKFTEGTGLGMNITKRLISLMKGSIDVTSEVGKGSTFRVKLRQEPVGSTLLGKETAANLGRFEYRTAQRSTGFKLTYVPMPYGKVLIVDDIETNIYVASGLLKPYGLTIESVTSGQMAIDAVKAGKTYDIIFMDHMMPGMDGIEATKIIRSMGYTQSIVALTANAIIGNAETFMSNGFDAFISKPIDVRQLAETLHKFVRDRHPTEAAKYAGNFRSQSTDTETNVPERPALPKLDSMAVSADLGLMAASSKPCSMAVSSDLGSLAVSAGLGSVSPSADPDLMQLAADLDPMLLKLFLKDARHSIQELTEAVGTNDFHSYQIQAHAMKSALANIKCMSLSALAKELEDAARNTDSSLIHERHDTFLAKLQQVVDAFDYSVPESVLTDDPIDPKILERMAAAAAEYDSSVILSLLSDIHGSLHDQIQSYLLDSDFEAIETACKNGK
jgi:signal transduction histidine kinase/DNA-binding NarL/FixJ family response regulator/HPt (histidine-containing phosphotransfer) domain-containing protein